MNGTGNERNISADVVPLLSGLRKRHGHDSRIGQRASNVLTAKHNHDSEEDPAARSRLRVYMAREVWAIGVLQGRAL